MKFTVLILIFAASYAVSSVSAESTLSNVGKSPLISVGKIFRRRKPKPAPPAPKADHYGVTIDVNAYPNQCGMGKMNAIAPHVPRLLSNPGVKRMILDKINKMFPISVPPKSGVTINPIYIDNLNYRSVDIKPDRSGSKATISIKGISFKLRKTGVKINKKIIGKFLLLETGEKKLLRKMQHRRHLLSAREGQQNGRFFKKVGKFFKKVGKAVVKTVKTVAHVVKAVVTNRIKCSGSIWASLTSTDVSIDIQFYKESNKMKVKVSNPSIRWGRLSVGHEISGACKLAKLFMNINKKIESEVKKTVDKKKDDLAGKLSTALSGQSVVQTVLKDCLVRPDPRRAAQARRAEENDKKRKEEAQKQVTRPVQYTEKCAREKISSVAPMVGSLLKDQVTPALKGKSFNLPSLPFKFGAFGATISVSPVKISQFSMKSANVEALPGKDPVINVENVNLEVAKTHVRASLNIFGTKLSCTGNFGIKVNGADMVFVLQFGKRNNAVDVRTQSFVWWNDLQISHQMNGICQLGAAFVDINALLDKEIRKRVAPELNKLVSKMATNQKMLQSMLVPCLTERDLKEEAAKTAAEEGGKRKEEERVKVNAAEESSKRRAAEQKKKDAEESEKRATSMEQRKEATKKREEAEKAEKASLPKPNAQCKRFTGVGKYGCVSNAYYGTMALGFNLETYKQASDKLMSLLQMVQSMGLVPPKYKTIFDKCMPKFKADICETIIPRCSDVCQPLKTCASSCTSLQSECMPNELRGKLNLVLPGGAMRGVAVGYMGGEGTPALRLIDTWLGKMTKCNTFVSTEKNCLSPGYEKAMCDPNAMTSPSTSVNDDEEKIKAKIAEESEKQRAAEQQKKDAEEKAKKATSQKERQEAENKRAAAEQAEKQAVSKKEESEKQAVSKKEESEKQASFSSPKPSLKCTLIKNVKSYGCVSDSYYGSVAPGFTIGEVKEGSAKLMSLLAMVQNMGLVPPKYKAQFDRCLPKFKADVCETVIPRCSDTCQELTTCKSSCQALQNECLPLELRSKLSLVLPGGAFRSIGAAYVGGEGSAAMKLIDAWLGKMNKCDSYVSELPCLSKDYSKPFCNPRSTGPNIVDKSEQMKKAKDAKTEEQARKQREMEETKKNEESAKSNVVEEGEKQRAAEEKRRNAEEREKTSTSRSQREEAATKRLEAEKAERLAAAKKEEATKKEIETQKEKEQSEKPRVCCRALNAQCLACAEGIAVDDFCAIPKNSKISGCKPASTIEDDSQKDGDNNPVPVCCKAKTAGCLSCQQRISVVEFCAVRKNEKVAGCPKPQPPVKHPSPQCKEVMGVGTFGCVANKYYGTVAKGFTVEEFKQGSAKLMSLLGMVNSMGLVPAKYKAIYQKCLPKFKADICETIVPRCSDTCQPMKTCKSSCSALQNECLPVELRGKLSMVMPGGAFRSIGAMYVGGEGSPALKLIDAWLDKVADCDSEYLSTDKTCLPQTYEKTLCKPEVPKPRLPCPVMECPVPQQGCRYVPNHEKKLDGCAKYVCGKLVCDKLKPVPIKPKPAPVKPKPVPVEPKPAPVKPKPAPTICPVARCARPKNGCRIVRSDEKNANGCPKYICGKLVCDESKLPVKPKCPPLVVARCIRGWATKVVLGKDGCKMSKCVKTVKKTFSPSPQCSLVEGAAEMGCVANKYYGTVAKGFTVEEFKQGSAKLMSLLGMVNSMGLVPAKYKAIYQKCLPKFKADICETIVPRCSDTCQPMKTCKSSCSALQNECLPVELRGKLSMVMPGGAFRSIGAMYVGGEGSPALKLIDAWLDKVADCDSEYLSKSTECLDSSYALKKQCVPEDGAGSPGATEENTVDDSNAAANDGKKAKDMAVKARDMAKTSEEGMKKAAESLIDADKALNAETAATEADKQAASAQQERRDAEKIARTALTKRREAAAKRKARRKKAAEEAKKIEAAVQKAKSEKAAARTYEETEKSLKATADNKIVTSEQNKVESSSLENARQEVLYKSREAVIKKEREAAALQEKQLAEKKRELDSTIEKDTEDAERAKKLAAASTMAGQLAEKKALNILRSLPDPKCVAISGVKKFGCVADTYYGTLAEGFTVDEVKEGSAKLMSLLGMVKTLGLVPPKYKTLYEKCLPKFKSDVCETVLPRCSDTCQTLKTCKSSCTKLQDECFPAVLRSKLKVVLPNGSMRKVAAAYVGGEGSPAMRLADAWLGKIHRCTSPHLSAAEERCLSEDYNAPLCDPAAMGISNSSETAEGALESTPVVETGYVTKASTEAPTEAPTAAPTAAPTEAPTEAPTAAPTEAPADVAVSDGSATPASASLKPQEAGHANTSSPASTDAGNLSESDEALAKQLETRVEKLDDKIDSIHGKMNEIHQTRSPSYDMASGTLKRLMNKIDSMDKKLRSVHSLVVSIHAGKHGLKNAVSDDESGVVLATLPGGTD